MKRLRYTLTAALLLLGAAGPAAADLAGDLQALNRQANGLQGLLQQTSLTAEELCAALNTAQIRTRDLASRIAAVDESLTAPLQVDADVYAALDQLFETGLGIANEALRLSVEVQGLSASTEMVTLKDAITAMLQLSSDIGTMADRIGTMADNILIMADNIGLMADRILVTQKLQNENVALTTSSILQTQANVLTLVSVVEDASYEPDLAALFTEGGLLAARMSGAMLTPWTMDSRLASVAADVRGFLDDVQRVHDAVVNDSTLSTITISYNALVQLGNLSLMVTSLASAVDGYAIAIGGMQAMTSSRTLTDALGSMLQLSGDIGVMANRILEMADQIMVMSDNIGLQADQVLITQEMMNMNVASTQTAILAAQQMVIGLIAARNL